MPRFGRWNLIPITLTLVLAGCSRKVAAPADVSAPAVATEPAHAASDTIGVFGGSVTATSAAGIRYTLIVPFGALSSPVPITITPVSAMHALPGGTLAAAVDCQPSGLAFARSALLVIEGAGSPAPGQQAIGFTATSKADSFALAPELTVGTARVLQVAHFSVQGVSYGTTSDLAAYPTPPLAGTPAAFEDAIERAVADGDLDGARAIAHQWERDQILPQLDLAAGDVALLVATRDYDTWRSCIDLINAKFPIAAIVVGVTPTVLSHFDDPDFAGDFHDCGEAAAPQLLAAVEGNRALACDQQSFAAFDNVLFWQAAARSFGVADAAHQLDIESVLAGSCARVVVVSQSLPAALQVGFPHSVDIRFALELGDPSHRRAEPFAVSLTATNATLQHPDGFSDAQGFYTTVITAVSTGPVTLSAHACVAGLPLCGDSDFDSQVPVAIDLTGTYTGQLHRVVNGFDVSQTEDWTLTLEQNQNAVTGTYSGGPGHSGTFSATLLSDGTFTNFGLVNTSGCDGSFAQNQIGRTRVGIDSKTGQVQGIGFDLRELDCHVVSGNVNLMEGFMSGPGAGPSAARAGAGRAAAATAFPAR